MLNTDWRGYRIAAWVGEFFLAIAIVFTASQRNWQGSFLLACFLAASFLFVTLENKLPTLFDFLFVVAALLNAAGWVWGLFYLPGPYDEITHAFTTFSVTLALSFLVYSSMLTTFRNHLLIYMLAIASFGIAIGAIWEITEWAIGVINSIDDTIIDLIMDTFGASLAALVSVFALPARSHSESSSEDQQATRAR